jgi:hypothetical protein
MNVDENVDKVETENTQETSNEQDTGTEVSKIHTKKFPDPVTCFS